MPSSFRKFEVDRNIFSFYCKEDADPQACWEARKQAAKKPAPAQAAKKPAPAQGPSTWDEDKYWDNRNQNQTPPPPSQLSGSDISQCSAESQRSDSSAGQSRNVPDQVHLHYARVGSYIREIYQNGKVCDVCFRVEDEMIPLHKVVLACHSPFFADVFESEEFTLDPKSPKQVVVRGVSHKSVKLFLEYMYCGKIVVKTCEILDLMKLAKVFSVDGIQNLCLKKVLQLDNEELLKLLPIVARTADTGFCYFIMNIISKNFSQAKECNAFFDLDIDTLCMLLSHDALSCESEMDIFYAGVSWMNHHDSEQRAQHLEKIMGCIRFPLMSNKELLTCYKKCPVLRESTHCMEMITKASWVQICLSLEEHDPLELEVPDQRNSANSSTSISGYLHNNSNSNHDYPDVVVEISHLPEDMARDFNTHALSEQYSKSKPEVIAYHSRRKRPRMQQGSVSRTEADTQLRKGDLREKSMMREGRNPREQTRKVEADRKFTATEKDRGQQEGRSVEHTQGRSMRRMEKKDSLIWEGSNWYMVGGAVHNGDSDIQYPTKEVMMYSYKTKQWTSLAPMRVARMQHALCVEDGLIYAIGGIGEGNRLLNSVECYNPRSNSWFSVKALREPRAGSRATADNGNIYLTGGFGRLSNGQPRSAFDTVECYNVNSNKWTKLEDKYQEPQSMF